MSKIFQRRALLLAAIIPAAVLVAGCSAGGTQAMKGVASPATPTEGDTMMTPEETGTDDMGTASPTGTDEETGTESPSPTGTGEGAAGDPRQAVQAYFDALKAGNVNQVVNSFSDDAVAAVAGQATATGTQAIRTLVQKQIQGNQNQASATHTIDESRTAGDSDGFVRSTSKMGNDTFREFFVLTQDGGQWKIDRFMNNKAS
ncbi:SnoaL-like domain-containing protein [Nonomuraea sp. NN258]|uniref:YybH family protein n=1 Tax=Nonomuraea antri TaxID=2730852 RepID=UPI0015691308|nr:nuclear transport factor 2 family protein [Nonomuraea antri]NRQ38247.1 SnoaL-like domain-containing protein [Nonomuraea antri]